MRSLFVLAAVLASVVFSIPASADRLCEGAVSAAACASHRAYLASKPFYGEERDTSPAYIKAFDPRYSKAMRDGGGVGGGGDGTGGGG